MESYLCESGRVMPRPKSVRKELRTINPNHRKLAAFDKASGSCWWIKTFLVGNDSSRQIDRIGRKFHQNF